MAAEGHELPQNGYTDDDTHDNCNASSHRGAGLLLGDLRDEILPFQIDRVGGGSRAIRSP
jgi:hypothetical protein